MLKEYERNKYFLTKISIRQPRRLRSGHFVHSCPIVSFFFQPCRRLTSLILLPNPPKNPKIQIEKDGRVHSPRHPGQPDRVGPVPGAREVQGHALPTLLQVGQTRQGLRLDRRHLHR